MIVHLTSDIINGLYELLASIFLSLNIYATYKAKKSVGINILSIIFFSSWGMYNLFFYHINHLCYSFYGGIAMVTVNLTWIFFILKYRNNE